VLFHYILPVWTIIYAVNGFQHSKLQTGLQIYNSKLFAKTSDDVQAKISTSSHDILVRAYKGEKVERTPVWLMRQVSMRIFWL
jgi:hypothetical protein